jgi:tetratricopeptide (TPR) repeat protein
VNMSPHPRTSTFRIVAIATMAVIVFGSGLTVGAYVWHGADMPGHVIPAAGQQRALQRDEATALDKRIDDANIRISDVVIALTIFALLMTVIIGGGTLVGFFGARQRAREAAEQWMEEHAKDLKMRLKKIEGRATDAERLANEADARAKEAERLNVLARDRFDQLHVLSDQFTGELEEARNRIKATLTTPISAPKAVAGTGAPNVADATLSETQRGVLKTAEQLLQKKEEADYSVLDWENRGITAFGLGDFANAATSFRKAAFVPGARAPDIARSSVRRGVALSRLGHFDDAIAAYDDVILHYKDDTDPTVREQTAKAFVNKIASQFMLGHFKDAIATSDVAVAAYEADPQPSIRGQVGHALNNKAQSLIRIGRDLEAIEIFDNVAQRYGSDTEPELRDLVIDALINEGAALSRLGRFDGVIHAVDAVLKRFEAGAGPSEPRAQSTTLANAAGLLLSAKDPKRALDAADKAIALADNGSSADPRTIAGALTNKAEALAQLDRKEEALAVLDDCLTRFKDTTDERMHVYLVINEFMRAVVLGWLGRMPEAIAAFDEIIVQHSASTDKWVRKMVEKSSEYKKSLPDQWKFVDVVWQSE